MRVTPRGSTSIDVRILIAETGAVFGTTKLSWYPLTSCRGKLQNSRPSSEYPPAKPRMPCAEMYLFGCACVVDHTGRSGTRCELADVDEGKAWAKPRRLRRRSIATERSIKPPGTAGGSYDNDDVLEIILPEVRIGVRKLSAPPSSIKSAVRVHRHRSKQGPFSSTDIRKRPQ